jgi:transcriptional regulator with XRE-family HTH domain
MKNEIETIGTRIRRTREERGMNVAQLARIVGVTYAAVWNWEKENGTHPRQGALSSLAKALGVSTQFLLSGNRNGSGNGNGGATDTTIAEILEHTKAQIATKMGLTPDRVKVQFVTE